MHFRNVSLGHSNGIGKRGWWDWNEQDEILEPLQWWFRNNSFCLVHHMSFNSKMILCDMKHFIHLKKKKKETFCTSHIKFKTILLPFRTKIHTLNFTYATLYMEMIVRKQKSRLMNLKAMVWIFRVRPYRIILLSAHIAFWCFFQFN